MINWEKNSPFGLFFSFFRKAQYMLNKNRNKSGLSAFARRAASLLCVSLLAFASAGALVLALPQAPARAAAGSSAATAVSYTLDMEKAIAYGDQWALSRNPLYEDFTGRGGNCANFVSQCMYAAGFPLNGEWYMKGVKYNKGPWFFANENYLYFSNYGTAEAADETNINRGDLVYYDWTGDGHIDHTALCVGKGDDGQPAVDSNTTNALHANWKLGAKNPNAKFYVIHLNRKGIAEKPISLIFDADYYYAKYEDVQESTEHDYTALLRHFLEFGLTEGRQGNAAFDPHVYKETHPDVDDSYGQGYTKYYFEYMKNISDPAGSMYRLFNPNSGEHFYTASKAERKALCTAGWNYEGIGWTAPETSDRPVYRMYNKNAGDHHYTMNPAERDFLVNAGWQYEGIGWYSADETGVPVYRQYNPHAKAGSHNYTANKAENDYLAANGWRAEGVSWYGVVAPE